MDDPDTATLTVLLIDDDDVAQEAVIRSFRKRQLPFRVITANDGLEGLRILRDGHPDARADRPLVVLLDLNTPRMNGFEFLRALRADPALRDTAVVVLTTSNDERDRARAQQSDIVGYVVKARAGAHLGKLVPLLTGYRDRLGVR